MFDKDFVQSSWHLQKKYFMLNNKIKILQTSDVFSAIFIHRIKTILYKLKA